MLLKSEKGLRTGATIGVAVIAVLLIGAGVYLGGGTEPVANPTYEDGTYTAYSDADQRWNSVEATVTIEDNSIVDVELDEIQQTGFAKGEEYAKGTPYWDEDEETTPFHEAMQQLPERFVEANSYDVEIVSGATGTSEMARQAVERALLRAEGMEEPFDGTFTGASDINEQRNTREVALVTVEDGKIIYVELKEFDDVYEAELKGEEYAKGTPYWDEDEETTPFHEAMQQLPERFIEAQSHEVEIYTGATGSSEGWMVAVKRALEKAGL